MLHSIFIVIGALTLLSLSSAFVSTNRGIRLESNVHSSGAIPVRIKSTTSLNKLANPDEELDDSSSAPPVNKEGYTQKQLLKEETEAPFRLVRIYFYASLLAAASLSAFICLTKILAVSSGNSSGDLTALFQNLGVNLVGIPVLAYLWKRDLDGRKSILERIQKGGSLAGLNIKTVVNKEPMVVKLADLRRDRGIDKRVVIVAATKDLLKTSLMTSVPLSKSLVQNDLLIVPMAIETGLDGEGSYQLTASSLEALLGVSAEDEGAPAPADLQHIGLPVFLNQWNAVIKKELEVAIKQQPGALSKGITIVIKKNGKVGTRRFGVPIWEALVDDVESRAQAGLDVRNI